VRGTCTFTFDDGPNAIWTPRVLAELDRCAAHATFFMIGECVAGSPRVARSVGDAGHDIELHCQRHIRHTELSDAELEDDTRAALLTFERAGLARPRRWRPPWGVCTQTTARVASEQGLELVHWTIDTHDWRGDSSAEMLEAAGAMLDGDAIVLMHDGLGPGARRAGAELTVELIAPLCAAARGRDLEVVPLSQADCPTAPKA
jgi:peptidoglycan/xylan/chitin deacetylase (PgdA/CDA1 family)